MCDCIYCRQEPDHQREQATRDNIETAREMRYAAGKSDSTARYQIERALSHLKEGDEHIEPVIAQLEAFLASTK